MWKDRKSMDKVFCSLLLVMFALLGCQSEREVIHERIVRSEDPSAGKSSVNNGASGTIDSGGGNSIDGKSLEDYSVDMVSVVYSYPEFPVIFANLEKRIPNLLGVMLHVLRARKWYMIPGNLQVLSPARIGVAFNVDQYALQNLEEVWFDSKAFNKMTHSAQVTAIMHEIVMGVRLLNSSSEFDKCMAKAAYDLLPSTPDRDFEAKKARCFEDKAQHIPSQLGGVLGLPTKLDLSQNDYPFIRKVTITLLRESDTLNPAEFEIELAANKFNIFKDVPAKPVIQPSPVSSPTSTSSPAPL